jgi:hypothetical protein
MRPVLTGDQERNAVALEADAANADAARSDRIVDDRSPPLVDASRRRDVLAIGTEQERLGQSQFRGLHHARRLDAVHDDAVPDRARGITLEGDSKSRRAADDRLRRPWS